MSLLSRKTIKELLKSRGLKPSKRFGQNFLIDEKAAKEVVTAAELTKKDTVLEIGPGIGALTEKLAQKADRVIAIEKDREMISILKSSLRNIKNVELIQADALRTSLPFLSDYKVIGNLPFYITAPIIRRFLEEERIRPRSMVFIIQKEVAQRICAKPPRMTLLSTAVQFYAEPKLVYHISPKSFWPEPEVSASIIKIIPKEPAIGDKEKFFRIVKAGFRQPRKQLINNLSEGLNMPRERTESWLKKNDIQPTQRAETLDIEDWVRLTVNC